MSLPFLTIIFGLILRIFYAAFSHDFWFDEAFNYQIAQNDPKTIIHSLSFSTWTPLYSLFMHYWQQISSNLIFLRLPSVVFGTLTLIVIYKIAEKLFNKNVALIALFFATVSPPLVYFSAENREYSLFVLLTALTLYFYLKSSKALFVLFATLSLYTHYFAALLLITIPTASFLTDQYKIKLQSLLTSYLLILLLVSPWLAYTLGNPKPECLCAPSFVGAVSTQLFVTLGGGGIITLKRIFEGPTSILLRFVLISFALLSNFLFLKSLRYYKEKSITWLLALYILPLVSIFITSFYKPLFSIRAFIFLVPVFIVIIAYTIQKNFQKIVPLFLVLSTLTIILTSQKPFFNNEPLSEMAKTLNTLDPQNTKVIHANLYTYLPARYYEPQIDQLVIRPDLPEQLITGLDLRMSDISQTSQNLVFVYSIDRANSKKLQKQLTDLYNAYEPPEEINLKNIRILIFTKSS